MSTDVSVEDVHFRRSWLTDEEVGYRCAAAALSDLAAMAATPVAVLVSMAAPAGGVDLHSVQSGVRNAAASVGAKVVGGDLSRSPGPLVLDVVVLGCTSWPVLRDGAEPDDEVWVTGSLGASAAAASIFASGDEPPARLRAAFAHPDPRVDEARWLVDHEWLDALIDLSDGLAGDAGHLAAASGVRVCLEAARIPVSEEAASALGREKALEAALHGGEDFELCFVTDPGKVDPDEFERCFGLPLTRVGTVEAGEGRLARGGGRKPAPPGARRLRSLGCGEPMIRLFVLGLTVVPVTLWYVARIAWGVRPGAEDPERVVDEFPRRWAAALVRLAGVRVVFENTEVLDPDRPQILVANHSSWFDVLALAAYLPGRYVFVSKQEVRKIPFLGYTIERCGHIYIDRSDHQKALRSLAEARVKLEREKPTVIMFPEGTRSETGELQRFKKGAFVLAIQTGAEIVPAAIFGSRRVMPKHSFLIHSGTIVVRLGSPIPVDSLTMDDRDRLIGQVREGLTGMLGSETQRTISD